MPAHPQSSPRGLFAKSSLLIGSQQLTANSTGVTFPGAIYPSGLTKAITANSTAVILPALRIGSLASYITVNSTGIRIGARYISTNTTGNTTT